MSIADHYNKTVSTKRLGDITGTKKEIYATHLAALACTIQAMDESYSEDLDGGIGKDYMLFCGNVDVKEGDQVVDGSTTYKVTGVKILYGSGGTFHHLEVRIREFL